ncbi:MULTISPECIES: hypothetical protein [unclassified Streptomyces]
MPRDHADAEEGGDADADADADEDGVVVLMAGLWTWRGDVGGPA